MKTLFAVTAGFRAGNGGTSFRWADDAESCEREHREQRPDTTQFRCDPQPARLRINTDAIRKELIGQWGLLGELGRSDHPQLADATKMLLKLADDLTALDNLLKRA